MGFFSKKKKRPMMSATQPSPMAARYLSKRGLGESEEQGVQHIENRWEAEKELLSRLENEAAPQVAGLKDKLEELQEELQRRKAEVAAARLEKAEAEDKAQQQEALAAKTALASLSTEIDRIALRQKLEKLQNELEATRIELDARQAEANVAEATAKGWEARKEQFAQVLQKAAEALSHRRNEEEELEELHQQNLRYRQALAEAESHLEEVGRQEGDLEREQVSAEARKKKLEADLAKERAASGRATVGKEPESALDRYRDTFVTLSQGEASVDGDASDRVDTTSMTTRATTYQSATGFQGKGPLGLLCSKIDAISYFADRNLRACVSSFSTGRAEGYQGHECGRRTDTEASRQGSGSAASSQQTEELSPNYVRYSPLYVDQELLV